MNIQVDPTNSNLASAMLNSKIRPRAVVGYGVKIFHPSPPNYVTRSPGLVGSQALANFGLPSYWPVVGLIAVNNSKFLLTVEFFELLC